jgi:hypothetical protein
MTHRAFARAFVIAALLVPAAACAQGGKPAPATPAPSPDSARAAIQPRGADMTEMAQDSSVQVFDALPNGGVIELQSTPDDTAGVRAIRAQLRGIAYAFTSGDFSSPSYIRMRSVPGAQVMSARRNQIRFDYFNLPRGGTLRMTTMDGAARKAISDFVKYLHYEYMAGPSRRAGP